MISTHRGCGLEVMCVLNLFPLTVVSGHSVCTIWNRPNYPPIWQCTFMKTSLRNARFFMEMFFDATTAPCSLWYGLGLWNFWTRLFPGPMMSLLDLSTEFNPFWCYLFIALLKEVLTSLVAHNRSFLSLPGSVLAPGMSQDQAVLKPKRILSGKLFTQGLIYDLWDLRHKSLEDRGLLKKKKQNKC